MLLAHFTLYVAPEDFNLGQSILFLAMLIVGGEGSIAGAVIGRRAGDVPAGMAALPRRRLPDASSACCWC